MREDQVPVLVPVLVTGGAGYIGSQTCKALARLNYLPVTYDNFSNGHVSNVRWGPLEKGDIQDTEHLVSVLLKHKIQSAIHFAAFCYVEESIRKPDLYFKNNVQGSLSLIEALLETKVLKLVFSSSCATYGAPVEFPIDENTPQRPISPYGQSKLIVEQKLTELRQLKHLDSISLRYFNAAGADLDGEIGEDHLPETHLIPLAILAALGKGPRLKIYGTDYETPDGSCIRDYIHVMDLADAHTKALRLLDQTQNYPPALNLGTQNGFSVLEIIGAVEKITQRKVPADFVERRAGDPPRLIAEFKLAQKELGWSPKRSNLDQIIKSAYYWIERDKTHLK